MAELIYKDLSYKLNGFLFKIHNEMGRYNKEKQYGDALEKNLLKLEKIEFVREKELPIDRVDLKRTNVVDFEIENKILFELKAKVIVTKEDYYQMQRYLQASKHKLGLIVNFRNRYLKPIRIIRMYS